MSLPSYRAVEPLYIIIFRNNTQAESKFRSWIKEHRVEHAVVQGNKMMLHHQQALDRFIITLGHVEQEAYLYRLRVPNFVKYVDNLG